VGRIKQGRRSISEKGHGPTRKCSTGNAAHRADHPNKRGEYEESLRKKNEGKGCPRILREATGLYKFNRPGGKRSACLKNCYGEGLSESVWPGSKRVVIQVHKTKKIAEGRLRKKGWGHSATGRDCSSIWQEGKGEKAARTTADLEGTKRRKASFRQSKSSVGRRYLS